MLTAAGASAAVPFAGWIAAGALLTAAGVTAIVGKFANLGRSLALYYAEQNFGDEGKRFAREFANASQKSTDRIRSRLIYLRGKIARLEDKRIQTARTKLRVGRLKDLLNANLIILQQRAKVPETAAIKGEVQTMPVVVQQRAAARDGFSTELAVGILGAAAVLTGVWIIWQSPENE